MSLKINKACDLNSISVLPPHARPLSGVVNSGTGRSQMKLLQLRSQHSQQSFSQGAALSQHGPFSQLSQCTPDYINSEPIIGSQEREPSAKRILCPPPVKYSRQDSQTQSKLPPNLMNLSRPLSGVANSKPGRSKMTLPQLQSQQSFLHGTSLSEHGLFSQLSQCTPDITNTESIVGSQEREPSVKRISCPPPVKYSRQDSQMQSKSPTNLIRRWQAPEQKCQHCEEIDHKIGMIETTVSRIGMMLDSIQDDILQVKQGEKEVVLELESIRQKLIFHDGTLQLVNKGLEDVKSIVDKGFKVVSDQDNAHSQAVFQDINSVLAELPHKLDCHVHKVMMKEIQAINWTLNTSSQTLAAPTIQPPQDITGHSASVQSICPRKPIPPKVQQAPVLVKNEKGVREKLHQAPLDLKKDIGVHAKVHEAPLALKNNMGGWKSVKRDKAHHEDGINKRPNQKGETPNQLEKESKLIIDLDEDIDEGFSCLLLGKERDLYFGSNTGTYTADDEKKEIESILRRARSRKRKHSKPIIIDCDKVVAKEKPCIIDCDKVVAKEKPCLTYARRRKVTG